MLYKNILIFGVIYSACCFLAAQEQPLPKNVVAEVLGQEISKEDVFDRMLERYRDQTYDVIQELVIRKIIREESKKEKITIDRKMLQEKIQQDLQDVKKKVKDANIKWEDYLRFRGITEKELKKISYRNWQHTLALHRLVRLAEYRKKRVRIRHIMTRSKQEAETVLAKLQQGADFTVLASQYSVSEETKNQGGEMPIVVEGDQDPVMEKAIFALKEGEISSVLTTKWGFHIFQMLETFPSKRNAKWQDVKDEINLTLEKNPMQEEDFNRWLSKMLTRYRIRQKYR